MPVSLPSLTATFACAAALFLVAPRPASAEGPGGLRDVPRRFEREPAPYQARRLPPEAGFGGHHRDPGPPGYGPPPLVRAYLPRNHAVPMYNEPPAR